MVQKLFIVAAGNEADYGALQRALAAEEHVTIVYDRRRARSGARYDERRRTDVAEQLQTRGWAVVRISTSDEHERPRAAGW